MGNKFAPRSAPRWPGASPAAADTPVPPPTGVPSAPADRGVRASFISWLPHCRRSDAIAARLGGRSHLVHFLGYQRPAQAPIKYVLATVATLAKLIRDRPDLVLVATPPVPAALVVRAYCLLGRARFVIDAHSGTFDDPRWRWALPMQRHLSRRAVATIVTGRHFADEVERWGARALIIGTVPVTFEPAPPAELGPGDHVMVVSTFGRDEPIEAIVAAARRTPQVTWHVTGNPARSRVAPEELPANVRYTGWLSDEGYHGLLQAADVVLCLTTRDHTMQRGGYEAMAVGKPLITSDWPLLRRTFDGGTVHVDNSPRSIADAVSLVLTERDRLAAAMVDLAQRRGDEFDAGLAELTAAVRAER